MEQISSHYNQIQTGAIFITCLVAALLGMRSTQRRKGSPRRAFDPLLVWIIFAMIVIDALFVIFAR